MSVLACVSKSFYNAVNSEYILNELSKFHKLLRTENFGLLMVEHDKIIHSTGRVHLARYLAWTMKNNHTTGFEGIIKRARQILIIHCLRYAAVMKYKSSVMCMLDIIKQRRITLDYSTVKELIATLDTSIIEKVFSFDDGIVDFDDLKKRPQHLTVFLMKAKDPSLVSTVLRKYGTLRVRSVVQRACDYPGIDFIKGYITTGPNARFRKLDRDGAYVADYITGKVRLIELLQASREDKIMRYENDLLTSFGDGYWSL